MSGPNSVEKASSAEIDPAVEHEVHLHPVTRTEREYPAQHATFNAVNIGLPDLGFVSDIEFHRLQGQGAELVGERRARAGGEWAAELPVRVAGEKRKRGE